jgi:glycerophosphoryl diester phosphodiesterase
MLHIDIKGNGSKFTVHKVVGLVKLYNRQSTTILGSFDPENVDLIRALDPDIPTFADTK